MVPERRVVVRPGEGVPVLEGGFGVVLKLSGAETGSSFSVAEHPLAPGVLAASPHTHANEDEFSFVAEGTVGVLVGDEVYEAGRGSYVLKSSGVPHTFWNAGPGPARIVEIISPGASRGTSRSWPRSSLPEGRQTSVGSRRPPPDTASPSTGIGWGRSRRGTAWG